ncbi:MULTISPECIES: metal-dependent hydrolase [Ruegeria]|uniref:metal-dependent hydrolase n=1 Tax=Ruegeria TaxID=97050 RepID=UPI00147EEA4A|nr:MULTISPECIES: metal-dependent hydrolase [Ruegeria]MBY6082513.1 metal-dependent hydrolase [Ruegeria arenilitoris]UWR08135.1 metal-dependent hydrolase [Ruegeria sp. B32]
MKIIWLGHGSFRIHAAGQVLLIDPWLSGNPMLPEDQHEAAVQGATHILLTHAHFDHVADVLPLAKRLNIPVVGQYDVMAHWAEAEGIETIGFNKGGRVDLNGVKVDMVPASHSSTFATPDGPRAGGSEVGFILSADGHTVYVSGDTTIMADMEWIGDYYKPDIGILSAGGYFTMDMKAAAYASRRYFDFKTVIPCHYRTFPILEQSAKDLADGLPGVTVIEPEVLQEIEL